MTLALAIDLGGTKVEAALVDAHGTIVPGTRVRAETGSAAANDPSVAEHAVRSVVAACRTLPEWTDVTAAGIGSAGPVDLAAGTVSPVNLPAAHGFPLAAIVRDASGLDDVTLRLDGTCIALAEVWLGAARGVRNAIIIVVSTGVGGGIVSDGRVLVGESGNAGHLGQIVVGAAFDGIRPPDTDPADATVERLGSGPNVVAWAQNHGFHGDTGEELAASNRAGDPIARAAVGRSARAVGLGLLSAATLLDLDVAVVGGGFSFVSDDYVDQISAVIARDAVNPYAGRMRVVRAGLGPDAPLVGAAALVHRRDLITL